MTKDIGTNPILVTGSHRGGTTWVGKMLALSPYAYYLGEVLRPGSKILAEPVVAHWFPHLTVETGASFVRSLDRVFSFNFAWPDRQGMRQLAPSRLTLLRYTRRWLGLPRPLIKDPIAALSTEWLAETFLMDVVYLVRHPAAFVASLGRLDWRFDFSSFLNQAELMDQWLHPFADQLLSPPAEVVEEGALLWLCIHHVLTGYLERHPEWLCCRLEDISASPVVAFGRIYAHVDLPYTGRIRRRVISFSNEANPTEAPPGDPHHIRRNSWAAQRLWRNELTSEEVLRIRRIVEPIASCHYGDADW
jgi:hypothetical protein